MKKLLILISLVFYVTSIFPQDFKSKLEKAEKGNSTAQYQVGYIYHNGGNGISRKALSFERAFFVYAVIKRLNTNIFGFFFAKNIIAGRMINGK